MNEKERKMLAEYYDGYFKHRHQINAMYDEPFVGPWTFVTILIIVIVCLVLLHYGVLPSN